MRWAHPSRHRSRVVCDDLTGLATRATFVNACEAAVMAAHSGRCPALVLVEIDGIAEAYDVGGHTAGDELTKLVAARLAREVGGLGTLARLADHEFAILFDDLLSPAVALDLAYRIVAVVAGPVTLTSQRRAQLNASCGLVTWDVLSGGARAHDLLRGAGLAVRVAKRSGKNGIEVCTSAMMASADERLAIGRDLRQALAEQGLGVCYQPIMDLATGSVKGFEALVRWSHPVHGQVSPAQFVPLAEEFGLINELGRMVLSTATAQVQQWSHEHGVPLAAHVNVSGLDLSDDGFIDTVATCLRKSGLAADRLVLEFTEAAVEPDMLGAVHKVAALHGLGIRVAIDDFGTGSSAVGFLKDMDIDIVKVARSTFEAQDPNRAEDLMRGVIALGQALGVEVFGEGIEAEDDRQRLHAHGCLVGQGYLFSAPMPAPEAADYLRTTLLHAPAGA